MPVIAIPYNRSPIPPPPGVVATVSTPTAASCQDPSPPGPVLVTPQACEGQNIIVAATPTLHGRPLLARTKTFVLEAGQEAVLEHVMQDRQGNPIALSDCLIGGATVRFRLSEALTTGPDWQTAPGFTAVIVDASQGRVQVTLPGTATTRAGVYFGEFAFVVPGAGTSRRMVFSNIVYVVINRGLWGETAIGDVGPPSVAEIRLHLRDTSPEESFLLDAIAFTDDEIAAAIIRPVEQWNATPPPGPRFTTTNFPYRYYWLEAICANLFLLAEERYRRNSLQYAAAGVQVNDYDKEVNYQRAGQLRQQLWMDFMRREKYRLNAEATITEIGGFWPPYG